MDMRWWQMWVSHPKADAVRLMERCDPVIQRFGSVPCAPDGIPVRSADGTIEVRTYGSEMGFRMTKSYLQDQGFVIEREQDNS